MRLNSGHPATRLARLAASSIKPRGKLEPWRKRWKGSCCVKRLRRNPGRTASRTAWIASHKLTYWELLSGSPKGTICRRAWRLQDRLVTGKKVQQALRRVIAETHLENPVRLRCFGRAAGKQSLLVSEERGFNVTRVGGYGLAEFGTVVHCEVGS